MSDVRRFLPPEAQNLLALAPEEVAESVLWPLFRRHGTDCLPNVIHALDQGSGYPHEAIYPAKLRIAEAWGWLEREGIIVVDPNQPTSSWRVLSSRAREIGDEDSGFRQYRIMAQVPIGSLHAALGSVRPDLLKGDSETAVFRAFKEVEIAVREAGAFANSDYGVSLMRRAFDPEKGPLRDEAAEPAERSATADLFAGGIGLFKNPASHRRVEFANLESVLEALTLASHLLRIVDDRVLRKGKKQ